MPKSPAMGTGVVDSKETGRARRPSVSIVFLVYNRRDELRTSLRQMLFECDYDSDRLDVIVVDNASTDGSAAMVREEFPQVRVIVRDHNSGVSGWNDGFAIATGDYVLAVDDDCYLPGDGLRRAVAAAEDRAADLVSFGITSSQDPEYRFNEMYRTGLLSFWGCAVLIRRDALNAIGGYDPEIFVWANELEFMFRFFDRGFRHLHLPELTAVHMKQIRRPGTPPYLTSKAYRYNARHFAYIAAKLMRRRDAIEALVALMVGHVRDGLREEPTALRALPHCIAGFAHGLRHRDPVVNPEVSRTYRRHFHSFASPWWFSRALHQYLPWSRSGDTTRRAKKYFTDRTRYYPTGAGMLEF